jgi:BASS family bile acid:Na+ symporter
MSTQTIVGIVSPLVLALLMWGVGLSIEKNDFRRVFKNRRLVTLSLVLQLLIMPMLAIFINWIFKLPPPLAVGLLLLASTPSGVTANILSYLARGSVALNISLTAINTLIGTAFIPLMVYLGFALYEEKGMVIPFQFSKLSEVFGIMFIPLCLGIFTKKRYPIKADQFEKYVGKMSFVALIFFMTTAAIKENQLLRDYFWTVGTPVLLFNVAALAIGFFGARFLKVNHADGSALIMEIGIHNCVLALGIALSPQLLNDAVISIPSAFYAVCMYFTGFPLALWLRRRNS